MFHKNREICSFCRGGLNKNKGRSVQNVAAAVHVRQNTVSSRGRRFVVAEEMEKKSVRRQDVRPINMSRASAVSWFVLSDTTREKKSAQMICREQAARTAKPILPEKRRHSFLVALEARTKFSDLAADVSPLRPS